MEQLQPSASIEWEPNTVAIIDNWRMLHRRPPVPAGTERTLSRIYAFEGNQ
ncbi:TauD/TfdA family dioxygenase [Streptomyces sp. NPDC050392]|uniref:TauD/TfdA family dioxygenase n=1 Tax=Streptomyces sp. NPDC050392 TaxID=3155782 RepID=UPI0034195E15